MLKKLKEKLKGLAKDERGFVGMITIIFISFVVIYNISVWSPAFFSQQDVNILVEEVIEDVEYKGRVDSSTHMMVNSLISKMKLSGNNINYRFSGSIRGDGKIQLRDEFTLEVTGEKEITLSNFAFRPIKVKVPLKKTLTGKSQVYYKPSEL